MFSDSFLSDAGWLFLALWGIAVAVVSYGAYGSDLFLAKSRLNPASCQVQGERTDLKRLR
jgi:hypothetical protein